MDTASPVSARQTNMRAPIARNFGMHLPIEDVRFVNIKVFEEDRMMLKTQKPERLPHDLTLEAHISADRIDCLPAKNVRRPMCS